MKRVGKDAWLGRVRATCGGISIGITLPPDVCRELDFSEPGVGVRVVLDRAAKTVTVTREDYDGAESEQQYTHWRNKGRRQTR